MLFVLQVFKSDGASSASDALAPTRPESTPSRNGVGSDEKTIAQDDDIRYFKYCNINSGIVQHCYAMRSFYSWRWFVVVAISCGCHRATWRV